ncbi:MAG TPA: FAD-dependent oxidoreductase [Opitutaceae bacterium]|nr:FAD-dependent oxidoreductase [Opitutaceae bacterium]
MPLSLRIVGQGIAGSLLAWSALRRGWNVEILQAPEQPSSSRVAAGIINPITGQRWVKSWRIDELLPVALELYGELEADLGVRILHRYQLRRFFRGERERRIAEQKRATGELAPYVVSADAEGLWIEPAFRVDLAVVVSTLRERWLRDGQLRFVAQTRDETPGANHRAADILEDFDGLTIWCRGAAELMSPRFAFAQMSLAKGEILSVESPAVSSDVILNSGHWLVPTGSGQARVGATYTPFAPENASPGSPPSSLPELCITAEARETLAASGRRFLGSDFRIIGQEVGWRVVTRDKHPVVGRHPRDPRHGILNGLGSKGALLTPYLAHQWCAHLATGAAFDRSVDLGRFV